MTIEKIPGRRGRPLGSKTKRAEGVSATVKHFSDLPDTALVSIPEAELIAKVSRTKIYRLNKAGQLRFQKIGSSTRIPVSDLRRLIGAA